MKTFRDWEYLYFGLVFGSIHGESDFGARYKVFHYALQRLVPVKGYLQDKPIEDEDS